MTIYGWTIAVGEPNPAGAPPGAMPVIRTRPDDNIVRSQSVRNAGRSASGVAANRVTRSALSVSAISYIRPAGPGICTIVGAVTAGAFLTMGVNGPGENDGDSGAAGTSWDGNTPSAAGFPLRVRPKAEGVPPAGELGSAPGGVPGGPPVPNGAAGCEAQ